MLYIRYIRYIRNVRNLHNIRYIHYVRNIHNIRYILNICNIRNKRNICNNIRNIRYRISVFHFEGENFKCYVVSVIPLKLSWVLYVRIEESGTWNLMRMILVLR